jgi:hypothetical protein
MKQLTIIILIVLIDYESNTALAQRSNLTFLPDCITLLEDNTVQRYIANYENDYNSSSNKKHTLKIDYPKEYFKLLNSIYKNDSNYNGVRFLFGNLNKRYNDYDMLDKDQIIVMAAPTIDSTAQWSVLEAFNKNRQIVNHYTRKVKLYNVKNERKNPSKLDHKLFIFPTKTEAQQYSNNYRSVYPSDEKYSESLFLCKENIFLINDLLDSNLGSSVDAISLIFIHYNERLSITKQKGQKQISLALVPSIDGLPQFNLLKTFIAQKFNPSKEKFKIMALNHGELCPNSCK